MLVKRDHVGLLLRTGYGFNVRLRLKSRDTGLPIDLTGATAKLDIRGTALDMIPIFSFSTAPTSAGLIVLNAEPGTIDLSATAAQTAAIMLSEVRLEGVQELKLTLPTQQPQRLCGGPALILKGITQ